MEVVVAFLISFCGPPCVGKGTVAEAIQELGVQVLSGSGILSQVPAAMQFIDAARLVPDSIAIPAFTEAVQAADGIVILDGVPRSVEQYMAMRKLISDDNFLMLGIELPEEELLIRAASRVVCGVCHAPGTMNGNMPNHCGVPMRPRGDDGSIADRIRDYHSKTKPAVMQAIQDGVGIMLDATQGSANVVTQVVQIIQDRTSVQDRTSLEAIA
jgi:adenylate kinase family enzyme